MARLSLNIGILLIILGLTSYYLTDAASFTALIPSFFGAVFGLLGLLGKRSESMNKHAMHAALLLAILGLAGSFSGLWSMFSYLLGGAEPARMAAAISQTIMAVLCLLFLILGIKSFIDARKNREA